jgi:hypothetical protein
VENSYAETLSELFARLPDRVQIPPQLEPEQFLSDTQVCAPNEQRRYARRKMLGEMLCQVVCPLPTIPRSKGPSKVVSLDISRSGFRFLIDKQLYPEEELVLWTLIGQIPCKVARCLKHNDACYEVGADVSM